MLPATVMPDEPKTIGPPLRVTLTPSEGSTNLLRSVVLHAPSALRTATMGVVDPSIPPVNPLSAMRSSWVAMVSA